MEPLPYPESQCHRCRWLTLVHGARSAFLKCGQPLLVRYPRQPVLSCPEFSAKERESKAPAE